MTIDPILMPFTAEELRAAYAHWIAPEDAGDLVQAIERSTREQRERYASEGLDDAWIERHVGVLTTGHCELEDGILALIGAQSPDAAARVDRLMEARWRREREQAIRNLRHAEAERLGLVPSSLDTLERHIERLEEGAFGRGSPRERQALDGLAVQHPPPPPATPAMEAEAETMVARSRAAWARLCEQARGGTLPPPEGNAIMDLWEIAPLPPGAAVDWARVDALLAWHLPPGDGEGGREGRGFGYVVRELPVVVAMLERGLRDAPREALPRVVMLAGHRVASGWLPLDREIGDAVRDAMRALALPEPEQRPGDAAGWDALALWEWLGAQAAQLARVPVVERWRGDRESGLMARLARVERAHRAISEQGDAV